MVSRGDKLLDAPLAKIGGKGLFVKELETALLENEADIAVHSMKDVPMEFPEGLGLYCICEREDPRDAFVSNRFDSLDALPPGSVVGTSSLRRQAQLLARRPDLKIQFLRGNVNTRLAKLDAGEYDAIILAAAGLIRLGFGERIRSSIGVDESLPAGGQGAVGIECRTGDSEVHALLSCLNHAPTATRVVAERAEQAPERRLPGADRLLCGARRRAAVAAWAGRAAGRYSAIARRRSCAGRRSRGAGRAGRRGTAGPGCRADPQGSLWRGWSRVTGWRLLLTRPAEECEALAATLAEAGVHSSSLPLLAIEPLPESAEQRAMILELDRYCAVVVVSKPAARLGLELLDRYWLQPPFGQAWFSVGGATGAILEAYGLTSAGPSGVTTVKRCWRCHDWHRRWPGPIQRY